MAADLHEIYDRLYAAYGPQRWWPADTPLEVIVGAILTQNTNWTNVAKAIANLREADALSVQSLHDLSGEELAELIRPCGYYQVKARRLKNLINYVVERHDGDLEVMFSLPRDELREGLLGINGVGPETADSILLYAGSLPSFVVDTYTHRVFKRHGWIEFEADYYGLKELFESGLERDAALFNEYHALLVRVGNQHCRAKPKCDGCPLAELLPDGGPLQPEW